MEKFITSLKVFLVFALLLGIIYPFAITGISSLLMPEKANGSLLKKNDKIIGSKLIAQEFTGAGYFHSRYSAVNYDAANSGASNLGPSNKKLLEITQTRIAQVRQENHIPLKTMLPADMVLASGSGLDPHISVENAMLQLPRVVANRGLAKEKILELIDKNTDSDFVGLWGNAGVNVLTLNMALDAVSS